MRSWFIAAASVLVELSLAVPNTLPDPTIPARIEDLNVWGWSPRPTEAPPLELFIKRDLQKKALTSGELIGYFAPDSICGYISASIGKLLVTREGSILSIHENMS
jgi:hypothetical protein